MGAEADMEQAHDYDWVIVGSGFGGSVSALRLAEKGYRVAVVEQGKRWADADFPTSAWQLKDYLWAPTQGRHGILRLSVFSDISIASGTAVGGGSISYANTLYVPGRKFFQDPQWADLAEWESELAPHYRTAETMLGVATYDEDDPAAQILERLGHHLGVGDTYHRARIGVFLGEPGKTVPDPYFGGAGPTRTGCTKCGDCMLGCRVGAKNTLVKNYLYLAERRGVDILAERQVLDVTPLDGARGASGYRVRTERPGAKKDADRDEQTLTARGVVLAAGVLGTVELLHRMRESGSLPQLSHRVGELVRTNGEYVPAVLMPELPESFAHRPDALQRRPAITSSIHPDEDTHLETLTYGRNADFMSLGLTMLASGERVGRRRLDWAKKALRSPLRLARMLDPRGQSGRQIILLTMQTGPGALRLLPGRSRRGAFKLRTEQDPAQPQATYNATAHEAARFFAQETGGVAESQALELFDVGMTAHPLGGATIGSSPDDGVVDTEHRVFGYDNLLICDASVIPANLGTNPSLTITALAERAMSFVPPR